MWDVIIVGGGYCGVTAALQLEEDDPKIRLLLLEAADQLGGRARSKSFEAGASAPVALDLGAHYFGKGHRRLRDLAEKLVGREGIYSHEESFGDDPAFLNRLVKTWVTTRRSESFGGIQGLSKKAPLYDKACIFKSLCHYFTLENLVDVRSPWRSLFARRLDGMTVDAWIQGQSIPPWIRELWGLACLDILSFPPREMSLLYWLWYHASNGGFLEIANDMKEGPQELGVRIGLGGLLQLHAARIRGTIELGTAVTRIEHREDRVVVLTAQGRIEEARRVIVAVTPSIARCIEFTPALHPARALLHQQRAGHAAKALLVYAVPWWRDCPLGQQPSYHYYGMSAGPFATGIEWLLDSSPPEGPFVLMTFVSPCFFEGLGPDVSTEQISHALTKELAAAFGDPRAHEVLHIEIFRWAKMPHVGGGPNTSLGPHCLNHLGPVFNLPEGPYGRLYFASSEYSTHFTGYVEGALSAGTIAAQQVAHDAQRAGEAAPLRQIAGPGLPGRGPRHLVALGFAALWLLLVPITALLRILPRKPYPPPGSAA